MDWFDDIRLNKIQRHMHLLWNGKDLKKMYTIPLWQNKQKHKTHNTHTHTHQYILPWNIILMNMTTKYSEFQSNWNNTENPHIWHGSLFARAMSPPLISIQRMQGDQNLFVCVLIISRDQKKNDGASVRNY